MTDGSPVGDRARDIVRADPQLFRRNDHDEAVGYLAKKIELPEQFHTQDETHTALGLRTGTPVGEQRQEVQDAHVAVAVDVRGVGGRDGVLFQNPAQPQLLQLHRVGSCVNMLCPAEGCGSGTMGRSLWA